MQFAASGVDETNPATELLLGSLVQTGV